MQLHGHISDNFETVTNKDEPKAQRQLLLVFTFHMQNWKSEDTPVIRTLQQILYLSVMNAATWPSPRKFLTKKNKLYR